MKINVKGIDKIVETLKDFNFSDFKSYAFINEHFKVNDSTSHVELNNALKVCKEKSGSVGDNTSILNFVGECEKILCSPDNYISYNIGLVCENGNYNKSTEKILGGYVGISDVEFYDKFVNEQVFLDNTNPGAYKILKGFGENLYKKDTITEMKPLNGYMSPFENNRFMYYKLNTGISFIFDKVGCTFNSPTAIYVPEFIVNEATKVINSLSYLSADGKMLKIDVYGNELVYNFETNMFSYKHHEYNYDHIQNHISKMLIGMGNMFRGGSMNLVDKVEEFFSATKVHHKFYQFDDIIYVPYDESESVKYSAQYICAIRNKNGTFGLISILRDGGVTYETKKTLTEILVNLTKKDMVHSLSEVFQNIIMDERDMIKQEEKLKKELGDTKEKLLSEIKMLEAYKQENSDMMTIEELDQLDTSIKGKYKMMNELGI